MAPPRIDKIYAQADKAVAQLTAAQERELIRVYRDALKEFRAQLGEMYAKYAKGGKLTYAEMSKYNRLVGVYADANGELKRLTGRGAKIITQLAGSAYEESFYWAGFALEKGTQARLGFGALNPETVAASVQNPISGLTLNETLEANRDAIVTNIRRQITQGLVRGESYPEVAQRIKGTLDGDATKALRVARTEAHRNAQAGRAAAFDKAEAAGVELTRVWVATLDNRTRDTHGAMDGQKADAEGRFHSPSGATTTQPGAFGIAGEDINCRCTVRAEIAGFAPEFRRARGEGIVPYKTYKEWKEGTVK